MSHDDARRANRTLAAIAVFSMIFGICGAVYYPFLLLMNPSFIYLVAAVFLTPLSLWLIICAFGMFGQHQWAAVHLKKWASVKIIVSGLILVVGITDVGRGIAMATGDANLTPIAVSLVVIFSLAWGWLMLWPLCVRAFLKRSSIEAAWKAWN